MTRFATKKDPIETYSKYIRLNIQFETYSKYIQFDINIQFYINFLYFGFQIKFYNHYKRMTHLRSNLPNKKSLDQKIPQL